MATRHTVGKGKKLTIGAGVRTTMGTRRSGRIVPKFYWREATDGTFRAPESRDRNVVWVQWDDGTKGWTHGSMLEEAT
jgi:hypothetical protein